MVFNRTLLTYTSGDSFLCLDIDSFLLSMGSAEARRHVSPAGPAGWRSSGGGSRAQVDVHQDPKLVAREAGRLEGGGPQ